MASFSKLEELDLTRDEVERFSTAFKDEKFRKMLCEYAEEISSPENKKKYEEEITQLEKERGMDIKFVHPNPGYVLKTSVNGDQKCFINVCSNDLIHKPFCKAEKGANGTVGQHWSLPYSLAPGREDLGKGGRKHMIYDVVFHPDTLYMANKNKKFKTMVDQTSIEVIEKQLNAKLDSRNVKTLKVSYKGMPEAAVIRKPIPGVPKKPPDDDDDPLQFPYPYGSLKSETPSGHGTQSKTTNKSSESAMKDKNTKSQDSKSTQPKYSIIHRSHIDLQDYRYAREAASSTRPKELVIAIDLPLLKSAENACLDVTEQFLSLESQKPAYKLDLRLPYPVDENLGSAMFNKSKRQLVVTLPVLPMRQALEVGQFPAGDFKQTSNESTESGQLLCKSDFQLEGHSHQQNGGHFGDGVNPESEFEFSTLQVSNLVQSENNEHFKLSESKTFTESTAKEAAIVSNNTLGKPNDVIATSKLVSEVDPEEHENVAKEGAIAMSGKESLGTLEKVCSHSVGEQVDVGADSSANTAFYYGDCLKKTEPVCPDFHYHQNKDSITFVLHVQNVNEESFKSVLHTHDYRVVFGTQDSDVLYSLIVQFPPEHQLDTTESIVNISKDNAAVVLMKSPECRGLWQSFHAGESCNCLQKNLCVTSENINQFLSTNLEDPVTNELPEKHPLISVVEISESGLVIRSKLQESENTSSHGFSLKPDRVKHNEACNAANVQQQTEETSFSESIAEGKILEEETPLANDAAEFVSNDKYQLVAMAGTDNFLETTNAGEGTNNEVPNYDMNQLTHSNCWTSVNASKLTSEVKMKSESNMSPSHASTIYVDKPLSINDEPLLVNCEKSVHFKQCTKVDDNVLDEDDLPNNQKDENTPEFINTTAPLQILEEINPNDQSVKIISDHKTKSAFNFQSMELYQLD